MTTKHKPRSRLNENLCPENFKICVPRSSRLLGYWNEEEQWADYLRTLTQDHELPEGYRGPVGCWSCNCEPGWELRGELAIAHACRVHDRIHRQLLSLEEVSAVDVGFAIQEQETRFRNFPAIRIHVNRKLSPEQLVRAGLISFTRWQHALTGTAGPERDKTRPASSAGSRVCCDPDADCPHPDRWRELKELLRRELEDGKVLRRELGRYPISGVRPEDLSIFCSVEEEKPPSPGEGRPCCAPGDDEPSCPRRETEPLSLDDVRLCICGVPIDVVNARYTPSIRHPGGDDVSGVFVDPPQPSGALENREALLVGRGRVNPLVGGVSVGSVTGQAGTLAAVVWDRTDGTPCVLSNWHVLAGNATAQIDQPAYQPALFDGGTEDDEVARLKRWHLGEEGDAALAELSGDRYYASGEVLGLWHPISGMVPPRLNLEIRKWGRTTGYTRGFVDGIHLATNIEYGGGVVRHFRNQFHIAPLYEGDDVSQVGDSGSLVVTRFRPVDMQEDLEQLTKWLRKTCDSKEALCVAVDDDLKALIRGCPSRGCPSRYCRDICDYLEQLRCEGSPPGEAFCCTDLRLPELCQQITAALKWLRDKCKGVRQDFAFLAWLENELEKLLERCEKPQPSERRIRREVEALHESISGLETSLAGEIEAILRDECGSPPSWDCNDIAKLLDLVRTERERAGDCVRFCRHVDRTFAGWLERIVAILFRRKLCDVLDDQCSTSACDDPTKLVDRIEKELTAALLPSSCRENESPPGADDHHQGKANLEEIKQLLEALLYPPAPGLESSHLNDTEQQQNDQEQEKKKKKKKKKKKDLDPDFLLKALRGTIRRYYRSKKNDRSRDTTRAYYAVGMIFAGDTPGSPFGEFAVASDISRLEKELRFSLRPVFEPRSSFRELRVRPPGRGRRGRGRRSRGSLTPGDQGGDPRGGGPQPDPEPAQSDPGG